MSDGRCKQDVARVEVDTVCGGGDVDIAYAVWTGGEVSDMWDEREGGQVRIGRD